MASLQPLTTFSLEDLLQNESFKKALNQAEGIEVVATLVDDTLDRVERTTPGRNRRNEALSVERVTKLLSRLIELTHFVSEAEPLVRSVCELAFNFIQWAIMAYHTRNARGILAIQQVWPAESAQIEAILISVKEQMEGIKDQFKNAVLVIQQAVRSPNTQQSTQALRRYDAMMSGIQPVFDTCLQYVKQAHAILKTLEPKLESVVRESKKKVMKASVSVSVIAGLAAYRFPWGYVASVWLLVLLSCFGLAVSRRNELLNGLSDYNTHISLIMEVDRMKSQLLLRG